MHLHYVMLHLSGVICGTNEGEFKEKTTGIQKIMDLYQMKLKKILTVASEILI